jgi:hypothetical protein
VIVCVLKLAEGVDLPKTQTVFLACPTGREIRLRRRDRLRLLRHRRGQLQTAEGLS